MTIVKKRLVLGTLDLDKSTLHLFFKHLPGGKGKEYQEKLKELAMTEQELVDRAIAISGMSYQDFVKEAMTTYAKLQITLAARRNYLDEKTEGSPETRLQSKFDELENEIRLGEYTPKNGRLNISAVATRAKVNFYTAKKWAEIYHKELLIP